MKKASTLTFVWMLLCVTVVNAQVSYTDVEPDFTTKLTPGSESNIFAVDFDGDGNREFDFRWDKITNWFLHMVAVGDGEDFILRGTSTNSFGARYLQRHSVGNLIDDSKNWGNSTPEPLISDTNNPNFRNLGDKYVGVRFKKGTDMHYAWVLVAFDDEDNLTVKSFAYETTPNKGIEAGDTGFPTSIEDMEAYNISVFPNPTSDYLSIENGSNEALKNVSVFSQEGRLVMESRNVDSFNKIDMRELKQGMYFLVLQSENAVMRKKILKK
ncbi:MAG: T9SS type A sorting domain-containing protein [Chitinophagales bacterium]